MKRYAEMLGGVSPTAKGAQRVADIFAALAPPPPKGSTAMVKQAESPSKSILSATKELVPGVVGAAVGHMVWKRHPILGILAGFAVGSNAMPIYRGGAARKRALYGLAVEGAAIAGSLAWKRHPVLGYAAGLAAGAVATGTQGDSPAREWWDKMRSKL